MQRDVDLADDRLDQERNALLTMHRRELVRDHELRVAADIGEDHDSCCSRGSIDEIYSVGFRVLNWEFRFDSPIPTPVQAGRHLSARFYPVLVHGVSSCAGRGRFASDGHATTAFERTRQQPGGPSRGGPNPVLSPSAIPDRISKEKCGNASRRRLRRPQFAARYREESPDPRNGRVWTSKRLVCHYCGSKDLAPSFIKRWDRRCRKCFSKRYGSAARARKAKTKEVALRRGIRDRGLHPENSANLR